MYQGGNDDKLIELMEWTNENRRTLRDHYELFVINNYCERIFKLAKISPMRIGYFEGHCFNDKEQETRKINAMSLEVIRGNIDMVVFFTKSDGIYIDFTTMSFFRAAANNTILALNQISADLVMTSRSFNSKHNQEAYPFDPNRKLKIVLIAHDRHKPEMVKFCKEFEYVFANSNIELTATDVTKDRITEFVPLDIKGRGHGPNGGDLVILDDIYKREIDIMIFFADFVETKDHDIEIKTLINGAADYGIPIALNKQTAKEIVRSTMLFKVPALIDQFRGIS